METFKEIKTEILALAKQKNACSGGYNPAELSTNIDELMKVVKDNFSWCYNNEVVTIAILDKIGEDKVNEFGIYYKGEVERLENLKGLYLCGTVKVKNLINSQVSVMRENSQVSVMRENSQVSEMWENSQVSEMWENSQVSEMWENSQVSVMRENSQVSVMRGNSQVSVMRGNSQVSVMRENSQVSVMRENSQVSEMWENSFARSYNSNLPKETHDRYCFMDLRNNKVYIGENLTLAK